MPGFFDDENFVLALEYAADDYLHYSPEREGRWRTFGRDGRTLGVIWTDDDEGAGFLNGDEDKLPGTSDAGMAMLNMFRTMKQQNVSAASAYGAMQQTPGVVLGDEQTGTLEDAMKLADSLTGEPMTAAADPTPDPEATTVNVAFDVHTEEFMDMLRSDNTGLYVYERGDWHRVPDEDDSYDGTEWVPISVEGQKKVEALLKDGKNPTREEMLKFQVEI